MKRLLSEMLSLADFDSRGMELHKEAHELDTLVLNSVETFEPVAQVNGGKQHPLSGKLLIKG